MLGEPFGGTGRVPGLLGRSVTGLGTSWRSGSRRVGAPSGRSGTGRGTLPTVRHGLGDPRAGSG